MTRRSRITAVALLGCAGALTACGSGGRAARSERTNTAALNAEPGSASTAPTRADLPAADDATDDLRKYIDQLDPILQMGQDSDATTAPDPLDLETAVASAGRTTAPDTARQVMEAPAQVLDAPSIIEPQAPAEPLTLGPTAPESGPATDTDAAEGDAAASGDAAETPEDRLARQLSDIQRTIADLHAGEASPTPAGADRGVELLALSLLRNETSDPELEAFKARLSPSQRRTLTTLEQLLAEVRGDDDSTRLTALDARRVSRLLSQHAEKLADARPLRISSAALCTSVESFGVYTRFSDYTFLQGRDQPVIVYIGLENFAQRPLGAASGPDGALACGPFNTPSEEERQKKDAWEKRAAKDRKPVPGSGDGWAAGTPDMIVQLTQSIAIHTDADDLVVWRAPEASIRDVSRERRQDYYLVQRVNLPARLTLGKYNMKITVRDVATGATDESVVPIEIVADPAIARGR